MADSAISALTAVTTPAGTDEFAVNQGGASKKQTLTQINAYCEPICRASNADQSPFATDTYLAGASIPIPNSRLQVGSIYECEFNVAKTAAGVAAPVITLRIGTLGTVSDSSKGSLTFSAQTAVSDEGLFKVQLVWRTLGSGTSGLVRLVGSLIHENGITGLSTKNSDIVTTNSVGYDSTVANSIIGLSVNGGASAAWTIHLVQSKLINLL